MTRDIAATIADYVVSQQPSAYTAVTLPRDQSLLDLGVLDSAGIIELIVFVESTWSIEISDEDITKDRLGSVHRIAALVENYLGRRP